MINIIKVIILGGVILVASIIIAKEVSAQENEHVKITTGEQKILNTERKKLGVEVIKFKTKGEEQIEAKNKKRLNIYKNRLALARFKEGEQNILVTGYSSTPDQCWGDPFQTASGTRVHRGTMACPPQYPFGTKIEIENVGTFICEDRGGAIKGKHFDMWFTSRGAALSWGKRTLVATITK
jgi:3D (Asp-Asp-Asp) domain-containing protein